MTIAPVDASVSVDADGEPVTLAMNFRTIALAEDAKPDIVTSFGSGKPTLSGMAVLVWAFARPAHPDLSQDQALALVMRHGQAIGTALRELFGKASAKATAADPPQRPGTTAA